MLVGLVVLLLILGGVRHRIEPWLRALAPAPRRQAVEAVTALPAIDAEQFGRVDLNRAGREELESLPGIGPRLAARIIDDRQLRGPYTSLADLDRVPGIGPHLLARIRDAAVVGPPTVTSNEPESRGASLSEPPPQRESNGPHQPALRAE